MVVLTNSLKPITSSQSVAGSICKLGIIYTVPVPLARPLSQPDHMGKFRCLAMVCCEVVFQLILFS